MIEALVALLTFGGVAAGLWALEHWAKHKAQPTEVHDWWKDTHA